MLHAKLVIDTFERTTSSTISSCNGSIFKQGTTGSLGSYTQKESGHSGCKYLTSSQLFSLQLSDPLLRQQISIQLLYFVHYFRVKALPLIDGDKKNDYLKDIIFIDTKAQELIQAPNHAFGQDLWQTVQRILEREEHWIRWKASSCQPFERFPAEPVVGEKRRLELEIARPKKMPGVNNQLDTKKHSFDCSDAHVKAVAQQLAAALPDFDTQIQSYLDAEDPDAGIEDEYHPKHDQ
jgi:hypothetical protein